MQIRNMLLMFARQFRMLQRRSDDYWRSASNSYLATSPEVYSARELALREALSAIGELDYAVDIGCGDGRFTEVIAEQIAHVDGYDISEALISQARARPVRGKLNARFHLAGIEDIPEARGADLVSCLGVTSCLVDDRVFRLAVQKCVALLKEEGYLILVDTLSDGAETVRSYRNGYIGKYRSRDAYEAAFKAEGFKLVERKLMSEMGGELNNYFYLLRRRGQQ